MSTDYYKKRSNENTLKLRRLLKELPPFCGEFFLGIEQRTSILTRVGYAYDLKIFFDFLSKEIAVFFGKEITQFTLDDLVAVTSTHLEYYLQYLTLFTYNGKEFSNDEAAKARKLACVKTMFKYFFKKDKLPCDTAAKVDMPKKHSKEITRLEVDEVVKLLNEAESADRFSPREQAFHELTKERDTAMLTLFLGTGIRISECVGLNVEDVDFSTNSIKIIRKGGNEAILYFSDEVSSSLKQYLQKRMKMKNIAEDNHALFVSLHNNRISVRAVQELVKKYAQKVTPLKHITPHKLRSTYGTALYRETQDIYIVADVLGHKDVNTTKKHYAAISDNLRRSAANKVKLREDGEKSAPGTESTHNKGDL